MTLIKIFFLMILGLWNFEIGQPKAVDHHFYPNFDKKWAYLKKTANGSFSFFVCGFYHLLGQTYQKFGMTRLL